MSVVATFLKRVWNTIASEPAVTVGVIVAAVNAVANGSDWKVYVAAVAVALFRFAVQPVIPVFSTAPEVPAVPSTGGMPTS